MLKKKKNRENIFVTRKKTFPKGTIFYSQQKKSDFREKTLQPIYWLVN